MYIKLYSDKYSLIANKLNSFLKAKVMPWRQLYRSTGTIQPVKRGRKESAHLLVPRWTHEIDRPISLSPVGIENAAYRQVIGKMKSREGVCNLGRWWAIIVILNREVHARWKSSFKLQRMESFDEPWNRNFIMPGKRRHNGSFLPFLPTRNTITGYYNSYEGCGWVTQRFTWELWLRSIIVWE